MQIKPAELGEAISLGLSILIVSALFTFLLFGIFKNSGNNYIFLEAQVSDSVRIEKGYILPVTIYNHGSKTISAAKFQVEFPSGDREIEIEYLPHESSRDVYLYLEENYSKEEISIKPSYYKLD